MKFDVRLKQKTMDTNWIIIAIVLVCAVVLIIFIIRRNHRDQKDVIHSLNMQEDIDNETELDKDIEL